MEKLVFFGDSFTYGHGLSDCLDISGQSVEDGTGPKPSKFGWAHLLCNMRNASGRNLSKPGASNLQILWEMLNAEIDPDETIIVQWSFWNRDCLLDDKLFQIALWHKSSEPYYKIHSNSDMIKRNYLNINHGLLWLQQKPNTYLMLGNQRCYDYCPSNLWNLFNWNTVSKDQYPEILKLTDKLIPYYFNDMPWLDMAEDNIHSGPKTNVKWANFVNHLLNSKIK